MTQIPLPEGAVMLTADELAEAIVTGDHPEADQGDIELDAAMIDLVRNGTLLAARHVDGRLMFLKIEG